MTTDTARALEPRTEIITALQDACCEARNTYVAHDHGGPDPDEHWAKVIVRALPARYLHALADRWIAPDDEGALIQFMSDLHSHVPEEDRPCGWASFSDEQAARIRSAGATLIEAFRHPSPVPRLPDDGIIKRLQASLADFEMDNDDRQGLDEPPVEEVDVLASDVRALVALYTQAQEGTEPDRSGEGKYEQPQAARVGPASSAANLPTAEQVRAIAEGLRDPNDSYLRYRNLAADWLEALFAALHSPAAERAGDGGIGRLVSIEIERSTMFGTTEEMRLYQSPHAGKSPQGRRL